MDEAIIDRSVNNTRGFSVARILTSDGNWMGCGFVIAGGRVMTCAHVIANALGDSELAWSDKAPSREVLVDFPIAAPGKSPCRATISTIEGQTGWLPLGSGIVEDIAVLDINMHPQQQTSAVTARDPHATRTFEELLSYGPPETPREVHWSDSNNRGTWVPTYRTDMIDGQLIEVRIQAKAYKDRIIKGFSGSAAWSVSGNGIIGMITMVSRDRGLAALRPVTHLRNFWPDAFEIAGKVVRSKRSPENAVALSFIDRVPQERSFTSEVKKRFDDDRLKTKRVLVCATYGCFDDCPELLRARFRVLPVGRNNREIEALMIGVEWVYDYIPQDAVSLMSQQLMDKLKASDNSKQSIASALSSLGRPVIMYTVLMSSMIGDSDIETIRMWCKFLRDISDCSLANEVYFFFDFCSDEQKTRGGFVSARSFDVSSIDLGEDAVKLPPFDMIRQDQVEPWFETVMGVLIEPRFRPYVEARRHQVTHKVRSLFGGKMEMRMSGLLEQEINLDLWSERTSDDP